MCFHKSEKNPTQCYLCIPPALTDMKLIWWLRFEPRYPLHFNAVLHKKTFFCGISVPPSPVFAYSPSAAGVVTLQAVPSEGRHTVCAVRKQLGLFMLCKCLYPWPLEHVRLKSQGQKVDWHRPSLNNSVFMHNRWNMCFEHDSKGMQQNECQS